MTNLIIWPGIIRSMDTLNHKMTDHEMLTFDDAIRAKKLLFCRPLSLSLELYVFTVILLCGSVRQFGLL